jgi:hypothetical protein
MFRTLGHTRTYEVAGWHFQLRFSVNVWCGLLSNDQIDYWTTCRRAAFNSSAFQEFPENDLPLDLVEASLAKWDCGCSKLEQLRVSSDR